MKTMKKIGLGYVLCFAGIVAIGAVALAQTILPFQLSDGRVLSVSFSITTNTTTTTTTTTTSTTTTTQPPTTYTDISPGMTAADAPSPNVVVGSSVFGSPYFAWRALDGYTNSAVHAYWATAQSPSYPVTLEWDGNVTNMYVLSRYQLFTYVSWDGWDATSLPASWTLQCQTNGGAWITIDTQAAAGLAVDHDYVYSLPTNTVPGCNFKLSISADAGSAYMVLDDIKFYVSP